MGCCSVVSAAKMSTEACSAHVVVCNSIRARQAPAGLTLNYNHRDVGFVLVFVLHYPSPALFCPRSQSCPSSVPVAGLCLGLAPGVAFASAVQVPAHGAAL